MRRYALALGVTAALSLGASIGRADPLDDWCAKASKPDNVVICADPDLRRMTADRNSLLADAKQKLSVEAYLALRDDEANWVRSYTTDCGVPADGKMPERPIAQATIDCFMRAGAQRLAHLAQNLRQQIPNYRPNVVVPDSATLKKMAEQDALERQVRLAAKIKELGYEYKSPEDFELDWRELSRNGRKVAIPGSYSEQNDIEWLMVDNKDQRIIRLATDNASREARKQLLDCRNSGMPCAVIVGAIAVVGTENKGALNEKAVGALDVREVFREAAP
jgi:hypothetical protein